MWPWSLDESQQSLVIAVLGFIGAFLLTHYFFNFRSRTTIISGSNSYDKLIESLLSQYSAKFAAVTKIIENINLRLELLEGALEQKKLGSKAEGLVSKSGERLSNFSLLSNAHTHGRDNGSRDGNDIYDIDLKSDVTKSYHQLHHDNDDHNDAEHGEDITNMTGLVLKLLSERSMNTVEIQSKVSRTREHTSRFMKRLFLEGLVSREMNTKPFMYTLTDEGRRQLKAFRSDA
jgi:predicted transcriptional regulator